MVAAVEIEVGCEERGGWRKRTRDKRANQNCSGEAVERRSEGAFIPRTSHKEVGAGAV